MDDPQFTRFYLESLTTGELAALADRSGIDIPRDLERVFIIEELLDLELERGDGEESEHTGSPFLTDVDIAESVPPPKQYNITYIDVLIRDPLWVFTFWEVKTQDKDIHEKAPDFGGYYLRVSPVEFGVSSPAPQDDDRAFTVPVGLDDTAWYLGFPPGGGRFKVELWVSRGDSAVLLAASAPFFLPRILPPPEQELSPKGLAGLSALDELPVLRNFDRLSRTLHGGR